MATDTYQSMRASLRPTSVSSTETIKAPASHNRPHSRSQSVETSGYHNSSQDHTTSSPPAKRPMSMALSRSDSVSHGHKHQTSFDAASLQQLQKSSTSHLRAISKFAGEGDDFTIKSKEQEVIGLHGRRRLQRNDSPRATKAQSGWAGTAWMDQQRQYLAAYEYLCHIGEAKEWIEDVIQKPIPPIVQLEEAFRNGIILADLVQALFPERKLRIFRGPNLTFRHSDNVAIFFRLLEEIELPDLFWFELVDLYEKKNIPKVIHCIHALSWLLWRKGITDFRIGNLVGQLQFEDHELEATQKGLDRVGINMPNFSGMGANFGAEPEPEPQESEDERIDRELGEQEHVVLELQAQIRGAQLRIQLGECMQQLWEFEPLIAELQAKIRGDFAREISNYRLDMKRFSVNLQAAARGYLVRSRKRRQQHICHDQEDNIIALQSLVRASKARGKTQTIQVSLQRHESGIKELQAAVRGALRRHKAADEWHATREAEHSVPNLQAAIRGALVRKKAEAQQQQMLAQAHQIQKFQSAVRGLLQRQAKQLEKTSLSKEESFITLLQSAARASMQRRVQETIQVQLQEEQPNWEVIQSQARAFLVRRELQNTKQELVTHATTVAQLQSSVRGFLIRHQHSKTQHLLRQEVETIQEVQSAIRGFLLRKNTFDLLGALHAHEDEIVAIQAHARALLCRSNVGLLFVQLEEVEDSIIMFQSLARGKIVRTEFEERRQHFRRNMEKVIKVQSFIRAKQQGEAYKILVSGKNPPVGTVKNFVHLLNDSDFDFDEEIEFERLRKTIVQRVRENENAEEYIDDLDIKIALLVKNKITLDEVVRHQKHFGGSLLSNKDFGSKDQFDLKALNKNSRKKLEHYQELFFLLQTQPQYLARLLIKLRDHAMPDSEFKKTELLVMSIYGFAQKRREEYYLLKLMARSIHEEIGRCDTLQDYLRGTFFWSKLLQSYIRSPRDRKYLRDLLLPLVKEDILENEELDLESDPMQIYRSAINNEELRTGQKSRRPTNISREEAIRDKETRDTFILHLQNLRDLADHFFICLEDTLQRMPYGIRFVAQQMYHMLCAKFTMESHQHILTIVGHWVWKTYIQPALLQPDTWGVVDRGLSPMQKRNLGEVSKVVGQIAGGRLFGGDNVYLQPINPFISESLERIEEVWANRKYPSTQSQSQANHMQ
jgi:Ras GTPase-activating-like protein IQGAP2/3